MKPASLKEYNADGPDMEPCRKFKLDPELTASQNLGLAIRYATPVVLRRYKLGNLDRELTEEIYCEVRARAYTHFIVNKVMAHGYCRQTKEGKPLTFFDNVISCCWSVAGNVMALVKRRIEQRYKTVSFRKAELDNEKLWDIIPDNGATLENDYYPEKYSPTARMKTSDKYPSIGLNRLLEEYVDYEAEAIMLGIAPISRQQWIERNATQRQKHVAELRESGLPDKPSEDRRAYLRVYRRERRARLKQQRLEEYRKFETDLEYEGTTGRK